MYAIVLPKTSCAGHTGRFGVARHAGRRRCGACVISSFRWYSDKGAPLSLLIFIRDYVLIIVRKHFSGIKITQQYLYTPRPKRYNTTFLHNTEQKRRHHSSAKNHILITEKRKSGCLLPHVSLQRLKGVKEKVCENGATEGGT